MKIYTYWTRSEKELDHQGKPWNIVAFGHSNSSEQDAKADAETRVEKIIRRLTSGETPSSYEYSDRPLREELKEEILSDSGEREAVITRNGYGSLVLNTARVMFIDIDFFDLLDPRNREGCLPLFMSKQKRDELYNQRVAERTTEIMEKIKRVLSHSPELGLRCYRTKNGFRLIVTSQLFNPGSEESKALLDRFGSDPLYKKLCSVQECYRARLTAKPWHLGIDKPNSRFPWSSESTERDHRKWEDMYKGKTDGKAVCTFEGHLGNTLVLPEVERIVKIHDAYTIHNGDLA